MEWKDIPEVNLYSDGGAEPNPGKGGFGVIMSYKGIKKEFSLGYKLTTNNRMELMGVIYGLERLKTKSIVTVYTDSQYVVNGIEKGWATRWKSNNWFRNKKEKATNYDLWDRLLTLIATQEKVVFTWIKGHAGHPENERCDELAMEALNQDNLLLDEGYRPNPLINDDTNENETTLPNRSYNGVLGEGNPCRKCGAILLKKPTKKKVAKPGQTYYYEYTLHCSGCKTVYLTEDAKRNIEDQEKNLFG